MAAGDQQRPLLALGNFTTTNEANRMGEVVDVENHGDRKFIAVEYLDRTGSGSRTTA